MVSQDKDFDPWASEALKQSPTEDDAPLLFIKTIEGIEPLDDQFGVHPPKTVPDALYEPFFGQPEPTEAEIAAVGGDPKNVPPMQTYAILDAAKVVNLVPILETSGLEHRCLFKGDAYDELKDVAPWIVRLEEGNKFTRHLFTAGKAPWYLWGKEPGIYVRSRATLEDMWRHFRKFTKVQDETGRWYYWRFWEGRYLYALMNKKNGIQNSVARELLSNHEIYVMVRGVCFRCKGRMENSRAHQNKIMDADDMHIVERERLAQFAEKCHRYLKEKEIGSRRYATPVDVMAALLDGRRTGLKSEKQFIQYLIFHANDP